MLSNLRSPLNLAIALSEERAVITSMLAAIEENEHLAILASNLKIVYSA